MIRIGPKLALVAIVASLSPTAFAADVNAKLTIPYQSLTFGIAPLWLAIEQGFFRQYGIDATTQFISLSPTLVASMLSGETPIATAGEAPVIAADLNGGDIVILASGPEKPVFTIYAAHGVHQMADLKGKKLGVSQLGSITDLIARYVVTHAGLAPDRDISVVPMGPQEANLGALMNGTIDSAVLVPPYDTQAKKQGFNSVADDGALGDDMLFYTSALVAKKPWVAAHPDETLNIVRGYVAGVVAVFIDKNATIAAISKYSRTTDSAALEQSYEFAGTDFA